MKKIEAGCLAIIINSVAGNNGVCVTVESYMGLNLRSEHIWEVDRILKAVDLVGQALPSRNRGVPERNLMRIDGDSDLFMEESDLAIIPVEG